jgi:hypothetical protein
MSSNGQISGTISSSVTTHSVNVTLRVQDYYNSSNYATKVLALAIEIPVPALSITTSSLTAATQGTAYNATMGVSGGTGSGYTWSATGLPTGLTISTAGKISGTPSVNGTFSVTLKVYDSRGSSYAVSKKLSMSVAIAPVTVSARIYVDDGIRIYASDANGTQGTLLASFDDPRGGSTPTRTYTMTVTPATDGYVYLYISAINIVYGGSNPLELIFYTKPESAATVPSGTVGFILVKLYKYISSLQWATVKETTTKSSYRITYQDGKTISAIYRFNPDDFR